MPMFQEHLEQVDPAPDPRHAGHSDPIPIRSPTNLPLSRKLSEESIRTELCDGPIPDSPTKPETPDQDSNTVSDRAELIERLKRGESPTWIPNRHLESLFHNGGPRSPTRSPRQPTATSPTLLPPATITPEKADARKQDSEADERLQEGLDIERPRSALHRGDFTHNESCLDDGVAQDSSQRNGAGNYRSGSSLWLATSPPRHFTPFDFERRHAAPGRTEGFVSGTSSLSSSLSQSFAYKAPTSPLVQSESNDEIDLSLPMNNIDIATNSAQNARRHTLNFLNSTPFVSPASNRQSPLRREGSYAYQAHQPRRSLTSTPNFSLTGSSPQTPAFLRSRHPSFSSDASPLQHASMVGSYEESILRGRMSTTPSKPLDFMAQIGVLGLGKCKASLRCPAHVTLPFSAVFYSYASTSHGRTKMEEGPSPYVGQIDLENGLPNPEDDQRAKRKMQSRYPERRPEDTDMHLEESMLDGPEADPRTAARHKRRSRSPKAPPGGRYRIPEKGQLQIIIKNQNKTAVKLFLVPYDLAGMEPGTKTFIRQRSYSSGTIIDNVPDLGDSGTAAAAAAADRPILRYLVHLHICSPARGRFYIYKSIRVVFANRVPDGKERLRNEVTYPEPRFAPYKPVRVMLPPATAGPQPGGPGAMLAAEKAFRRRSSGFSFGHHHLHHAYPYPYPHSHQHQHPHLAPFSGGSGYGSGPSPSPAAATSPLFGFPGGGGGPGDAPVEPIPCALSRTRRLQSDASSESDAPGASLYAPPQTTPSSPALSQTQTSRSATGGGGGGGYGKLSRGDVGYGGNAFAPCLSSTTPSSSSSFSPPSADGAVAATEGLLSKRLRSLGVQGRPVGEGGGGVEMR